MEINSLKSKYHQLAKEKERLESEQSEAEFIPPRKLGRKLKTPGTSKMPRKVLREDPSFSAPMNKLKLKPKKTPEVQLLSDSSMDFRSVSPKKVKRKPRVRILAKKKGKVDDIFDF
jgi:hypothetical protein